MSQPGKNHLVFQESKIYTFEIHLFLFKNTKQTNDSIFPNKTGEKFNLAKIFPTLINILT